MSSVSAEMGARRAPARLGRALLLAVAALLAPPAHADDPGARVPAAQADGAGGGVRSNGSAATFRGNRALDDGQLRRSAADELKDFANRGQRPADADDAAFQMEVAYRKTGYAFATVDYEITRAPAGTQLLFLVNEGPRVVLGEIEIRGNAAIPRDELLRFFEVERKGLLGNGPRIYVRTDLESAVAGIRNLYRVRGYLDAAVTGPVAAFSEDRSSASVAVEILEGPRYWIGAVVFSGDVLPEAAPGLERIREDLVGTAFFPRKRMLLSSRLLEVYGDLGYPRATVHIRDERDPNGRVLLSGRIESGPLTTIADVVVRGNQKTRTAFIRRRVPFEPGERYSLAKERETFRRLYRTGVFTKVDVTLEASDEEGRDVLVVEVQEAPSRELSVEPGWGSYELARLTVGYRHKNVLGTGRIFGTELTGSMRMQRVSATYTDPWFLNTEITAEVPVVYQRRLEPSYDEESLGAGIALSQALSDNLSATAGYKFRKTDLSNVSSDEADTDTAYNLASVGAQLTYDTRNDLFFPTDGLRGFGALERADKLLGGNISFTRLTLGARTFFTLRQNRTILALRYATGLLVPGEDDVTVPLAERFFLGGGTTVRSFDESELGPQDDSGDPAGGYAFNLVSVELRQRLTGNWVGALFVDYGNVAPNRTRSEQGLPPYESRSQLLSDTFGDFLRGFRPAVGCGIQYLLPVGPARLDLAFNPDADKDRNEESYRIQFSIGAAF